MKHIGIIMSAGKGLRVGGDVPKQYMDLCGHPVIYYAIKAMEDSFIDGIILVVGSGDEDFVRREIVEASGFKKVRAIVPGGVERFDSVRAGLEAVSDKDAYVYIQDGARPMLTPALLLRVKEDVELHNATIAAVKTTDTVKVVSEEGFVVSTPDRKTLWNVQTPQAFKLDIIARAYEDMAKDPEAFVTDDSQVVERYSGIPVHITEGDYRNIKITTAGDFETAKIYLNSLLTP